MGSQRWGLLVSLSGELLVLGILLLIPLAWTDRLPHPDWRSPVVLGAPPPLRAAAPSESHASARTTSHPPVLFRLVQSHAIAKPASQFEFMPPGEPPGVPGGLETGAASALPPALQAIKPPPPAEKPKPKPKVEEPKPPPRLIAVSKGAQLAKLIRQVKPIYPFMAKQARVSGTVLLVGVISKDGTIRNLQVLSGNPLLVRAAVDAVSQWIYRPTLLNGEPVEVTAPIEVNFILTQ